MSQLEQESRSMLAHGKGKVPGRSLYLSHISHPLLWCLALVTSRDEAVGKQYTCASRLSVSQMMQRQDVHPCSWNHLLLSSSQPSPSPCRSVGDLIRPFHQRPFCSGDPSQVLVSGRPPPPLWPEMEEGPHAASLGR